MSHVHYESGSDIYNCYLLYTESILQCYLLFVSEWLYDVLLDFTDGPICCEDLGKSFALLQICYMLKEIYEVLYILSDIYFLDLSIRQANWYALKVVSTVKSASEGDLR